MEEENKNQQPFEQNGENFKENVPLNENTSEENIENVNKSEEFLDLDENNRNSEVIVICEQPENEYKDVKNKDKKIALIFSLLGLLFSVFYIGIVFSLIGFILTVSIFSEIKKSTLVKWSLITSICGIVISVIFIIALNVF